MVWLLVFLIALLDDGSPQLGAEGAQEHSVSGKVTDIGHRPLAGIAVYSSPRCCPLHVGATRTDESGIYMLEAPGAVVHFRAPGFQPLTKLTSQKETDVVLRPAESYLVISACPASQATNSFGGTVRFTPPALAHVLSRTGTDFTAHLIRRVDSGALLRIWSGAMAGNMDAKEELYLESASFHERFVTDDRGKIIGIDASGTTADSRRWRWVGLNPFLAEAWPTPQNMAGSIVAPEMARYEDATSDDSEFFDRIIDGVCIAPPAHR